MANYTVEILGDTDGAMLSKVAEYNSRMQGMVTGEEEELMRIMTAVKERLQAEGEEEPTADDLIAAMTTEEETEVNRIRSLDLGDGMDQQRLDALKADACGRGGKWSLTRAGDDGGLLIKDDEIMTTYDIKITGVIPDAHQVPVQFRKEGRMGKTIVSIAYKDLRNAGADRGKEIEWLGERLRKLPQYDMDAHKRFFGLAEGTLATSVASKKCIADFRPSQLVQAAYQQIESVVDQVCRSGQGLDQPISSATTFEGGTRGRPRGLSGEEAQPPSPAKVSDLRADESEPRKSM